VIELHYACFHLPELCECPHHEKKFVCKFDSAKFGTFKEALEALSKWNQSPNGRCWVYAPRSFERV
jgi:hypothetical protein